MKYLLVDFGSTYTKLTAVDRESCTIIGTAKSITTIETNILDGYSNALKELNQVTGLIEYDEIKACSSAAGGLSMAAIGLVPELTVEAAKRACLGAGAKVSSVFTSELTNSEVKSIKDNGIDIILLAGGTDGGNSKCILFNAQKLADNQIDIPVIVAGNKSCQDEISEIFINASIDFKLVENVMPKINELNIDNAKEEIRKIFLNQIIEAKGIKKAEELVGEVIMPTPEAVLRAATLLADGYEDERGIGDLIIVDIGGATTDIHSIGYGTPSRGDVNLKGLAEPYSKRTVEGDLGMRYSVMSILEGYGEYELNTLIGNGIDMKAECEKRHNDITLVPESDQDYLVEKYLGYACCDISISRHVGVLESIYTPVGRAYYQIGKDLTKVKTVIGTGGVIVNSPNYKEILSGVCANAQKITELRPKEPNYKIDKEYILSAMGILSEVDKLTAIKLMKKYIMEDTING